MKITENFDSDEFKCKCGKCNLEINESFVAKLQLARDIAKIPFTILSGCRCPERNKLVGGKANSSHLRCLAADIEVNSRTKYIILDALKKVGFIRVAAGDGFIHCDIDKSLPQVGGWKY